MEHLRIDLRVNVYKNSTATCLRATKVNHTRIRIF